MSNAAIPASSKPKAAKNEAASRSAAPKWWIICLRELSDLWIGGKALILTLVYCVVLAIFTFVLAQINQTDLIPPKEMVVLILQSGIYASLLIGVIVGADSVSGERERGSLEALLLTPVSRREIIFGKFLAAFSPWPAALLTTIPYLYVLAQSDEIFGFALLLGAFLGSLLIAAYTGFAILVSAWCNSNRTSLFMSLVIYLLCLLPTQLPSGAQKGAMGYFLKRINPMESINHLLENVVVNNRTIAEMQSWFRSPVIFALLVFGLLFLYIAPNLGLDASSLSSGWLGWGAGEKSK